MNVFKIYLVYVRCVLLFHPVAVIFGHEFFFLPAATLSHPFLLPSPPPESRIGGAKSAKAREQYQRAEKPDGEEEGQKMHSTSASFSDATASQRRAAIMFTPHPSSDTKVRAWPVGPTEE